MGIRQYSVRELKRIIAESSTEFKPMLGKNVENDNKKINDKAYKEVNDKVKSYDGGLKKESPRKVSIPDDDNKGMQDLNYDNINKPFQDRVKSQLKGYVSSDSEKKYKNDEFGNATFDEIEGMDEKNKKFRKGKEIGKEIGLTSREIDKKDFQNLTHSVFESNKSVVLKFKNTVFLTENQVISKIPDEYKLEGKKFYMKDKLNNEFMVEWHEKPSIMNLTKINEEQHRIKELFNYKSNKSSTSCESRIVEENKVNDMLDKARKLMN